MSEYQELIEEKGVKTPDSAELTQERNLRSKSKTVKKFRWLDWAEIWKRPNFQTEIFRLNPVLKKRDIKVQFCSDCKLNLAENIPTPSENVSPSSANPDVEIVTPTSPNQDVEIIEQPTNTFKMPFTPPDPHADGSQPLEELDTQPLDCDEIDECG